MRDIFKILTGLLFLLIIGCSSSNTESAGEYLDSSTTTTKVKASLLDALGGSGFEVRVRTFKDEVQLSGFVDNAQIKHQAGVVASRVNGVKRVRNNLVVKSQ
jgi:osmotically-inducible protein OsmY